MQQAFFWTMNVALSAHTRVVIPTVVQDSTHVEITRTNQRAFSTPEANRQ